MWRTAVLVMLLCALWSCCHAELFSQDECPFADEIHQLPTTTAGLWRQNRIRLVTLARSQLKLPLLIFLSGGTEVSRYPFRQESNFYYVTGANMPDYLVSLEVTANNPVTTLFVPAPSADYAIWNGQVYSKAQLQAMYDVDEVLYTNETTVYANRFPSSTTVYTTTSATVPTPFNKFIINKTTLSSYLVTARATKSDKEIILMTLVNEITSNAHVSAMQFIASRLNISTSSSNANKSIKQNGIYGNALNQHFNAGSRSHLSYSNSGSLFPFSVPMDDVALKAMTELSVNFNWKPQSNYMSSSMSSNPLYEYEVESLFLYQCGLCGALQQAYLPIVGAGDNGAILHYIANSDEIQNGEMLLIDAGAEYWGYGSDVTRTYPVNGIFTDAQKLIYNIVLQTQSDVAAAVKNGTTWSTLNTVARESITKYLLHAGLIQGTLQQLMQNSVYSVFYPHSIGHSVGLDVHDAQTSILYTNQVITVEPGVYFNSFLLDQAYSSSKSKFIVWDKVNAYRGTGGVRIEDDYVVTATGFIKITTVPSDIDEIEKIMQR